MSCFANLDFSVTHSKPAADVPLSGESSDVTIASGSMSFDAGGIESHWNSTDNDC